jgi:translation initiation factor IF-3
VEAGALARLSCVTLRPDSEWLVPRFSVTLGSAPNPLHAIIFHLIHPVILGGGLIDKRFIRTNDRIRAREIRVIDDEGNQIGILPPYDALKMAREKNLDLVEISPTAVPPVCRIMDYGKFLYQQEKKEREAKKHQKTIVVKEVKFRINVDDHDYDTKKNHVLRFLDEGDKVKATIFFRGREMTRTGLGRQILERLIKDVEDKAIVEFRPRQEGNTLHAILAPKKSDSPKKGGEKPSASQQPQQSLKQA